MAFVTQNTIFAWGARQGQVGNGLVADSASWLIPFKEQERARWHQLTLRLYDLLNPQLIQYLRRIGLNKDEMDDVIQESFLRLAGHLEKGGTDKNLSSWVYRVAHNLAMDLHRSHRREHEELEAEFKADDPVDPKANPETAYLQKERVKRLKAVLSQLTPQQYSGISLRAQGLQYREIAVALGVSEQRAIRLVKRALQRLVGGLRVH